MTGSMWGRWLRLLVILVTMGLLAAACGDGDDSSQTGESTGETSDNEDAGDETADEGGGGGDDAGADAAPAGPTQGGELRVSYGLFHQGWDPQGATDVVTIQYIQHVMEPLIRANSDGVTVAPGLADSWEYDPDALTFTFELNPDATFSDGTPVTSADVVFSVNEWKAGINYGRIYAAIADAEAIDDHTVVLNLAYPDSSLEALLTWQSAAIMKENFGGMTREEYLANPIGAGPFAIESWTPSAELILVRNEHYHREGRPYLDRIVITESGDPNQTLVSYESGDAHLTELPPDQVGAYPEDEVVTALQHFTSYVAFNTRFAPLDDVRVRQAIALALDYESLVALGNGLFNHAEGALPPNVYGWAPPTDPYWRQDVAAARALLDEAGVGDLSFELLHNSGAPEQALVAQVVQSSLAEIGIDVEVVGLESLALFETLLAGQHQMAVTALVAISPTIVDSMVYALGFDYLFTGYPVDTLLAGLMQFIGTTDPAEQQAAVTMIQDEMSTEAPLVAIYTDTPAFLVKPNVKGFDPAPWTTWWYDQIYLSE